MSGLPERQFVITTSGEKYERYPTFFGYSAWCIELAISSDDDEMLEACETAGFLNKDTETVDGLSMAMLAKKKNAKRCLEWFVKNGYPMELCQRP